MRLGRSLILSYKQVKDALIVDNCINHLIESRAMQKYKMKTKSALKVFSLVQ
ncbi:hypothetical protein [Aridibaculum aurantiacum]|uniref:hypothetical protein n=1 Tax=Aridibaculum aurantiacum TaxID=2810307 RepID=UPI001A95E5AD|nr:hypothetical protein [Aridibaculum aurantiacum]